MTSCSEQKHFPQATQGTLDLASWDFEQSGPANISGTWEFHWQKLLRPEAFKAESTLKQADYFRAPGLWRGTSSNGVPLSASGYATYRVRIHLPALPAVDAAPLSLLVNSPLSACKVWINGTLRATSGETGADKKSEHPKQHFVVANIAPNTQHLDIVMQVSNFHNAQGGLAGHIALGTTQQIQKKLGLRWLNAAFAGGALLCMSLYHFALFLMRRTAKHNVFFALFCLCWSITAIAGPSSGFLLDAFTSFLPWTWYTNITLLPHGMTVPLLLIFYQTLFPKKYGKQLDTFFLLAGILFSVYILVTPGNAYDPVAFIFFLLTRLAFLYLFAMFVVDVVNKEDGILLLAPGYIGLAYAELDEILFDLNILPSADFGLYGVFLFILCYSFFVSSRLAQAFSNLKQLSTNLKKTNVRLQQLNQLKDTFLANTTHELKTPLTGMIGIAETLLAGSGGKLPDVAREQLHILAYSGKRLANLVNDVLDMSRLEHQDVTLRKTPVSLQETTQRILALFRQTKKDHGIELVNGLPSDFPPLWADQDRLEQILVNLVSNALKFTKQGNVTIRASQKGNWAEISVIDTGVGIPAEDHERIFNSYEQLDTTRNNTGGTGLGLAISRRLVELHEGSMRVDSEPGQGSTFTFTLPLSTDKQQPRSVTARGCKDNVLPTHPYFAPETNLGPTENSTQGHCQVLVVDDEPVNLHVIASCLRLANVTFCTARTGNDALCILSEQKTPDIILLDVMMPGLNGYDTCKEIRKKHSAAALPVIMLTVRDRVEDVVQGFAAGANDYVTKPFAREELIARVSTQLKVKEAYTVLADNVRLKHELDIQRKTEQHMRLVQLRLSQMLHSLDDAVVAVNQAREICFSNKAFASLTGYARENLMGRPFDALLETPQDTSLQPLLKMLNGSASQERTRVYEGVLLSRTGGGGCSVNIFATPVELEEEPLFLLVARTSETTDSSEQTAGLTATLLREMSNNRQRIHKLEHAIQSFELHETPAKQLALEDLNTLDKLLDRLGKRFGGAFQSADRKRQLAVRVMTLAVDCWSVSTETTKVELAEQSRIWTVYMEKDGYQRTQTLDKYLSMDTLPAHPRWRQVHATAEFVLATCTPDSPAAEELSQALITLKAL